MSSHSQIRERIKGHQGHCRESDNIWSSFCQPAAYFEVCWLKILAAIRAGKNGMMKCNYKSSPNRRYLGEWQTVIKTRKRMTGIRKDISFFFSLSVSKINLSSDISYWSWLCNAKNSLFPKSLEGRYISNHNKMWSCCLPLLKGNVLH